MKFRKLHGLKFTSLFRGRGSFDKILKLVLEFGMQRLILQPYCVIQDFVTNRSFLLCASVKKERPAVL